MRSARNITAAFVLAAFITGWGGSAVALSLDDTEKADNDNRRVSKHNKQALEEIIKAAKDLLDKIKEKYGENSEEYKKAKKKFDEAVKAVDEKNAKDQKEEDENIDEAESWHKAELRRWDRIRPPHPCCFSGDLLVDGTPGASHDEQGATITLSFTFDNAMTGIPTGGGPAIGSVLYEVNRDPDMPSVFDPIGVSTDAGKGFGQTFTIDSYEPMFEAIPFDPSGAPIFISGIDGENEAVAFNVNIPGAASRPLSGVIPEPSGWAMMILGAAGLGAMTRMRRRLGAA
jgi:hypothetical protein